MSVTVGLWSSFLPALAASFSASAEEASTAAKEAFVDSFAYPSVAEEEVYMAATAVDFFAYIPPQKQSSIRQPPRQTPSHIPQ